MSQGRVTIRYHAPVLPPNEVHMETVVKTTIYRLTQAEIKAALKLPSNVSITSIHMEVRNDKITEDTMVLIQVREGQIEPTSVEKKGGYT